MFGEKIMALYSLFLGYVEEWIEKSASYAGVWSNFDG